jgi:pyruvate,water dikinase
MYRARMRCCTLSDWPRPARACIHATGSNDLTQLTLGVDRDSGVLSGFDERDDAVKALMGMAIDAANAAGKYVGICGQAPSDFPELAAWLVARGMRSLSLNSDSVLAALAAVAQAEEEQPQGGNEAASQPAKRAVE